MNKILVPIDFSDASLNALSYATKLFTGSSLEITLLHTYKMSSNAFHMISMDKILQDDAQRDMDAVIKRFKEEQPDIILKTMILKSDTVSAITSLGNRGTYDFIVMGTKGASGLKEVFIGSVAGGVISKTTAPVIVVPGNYHYRPLRDIVFAVSGIPFSNTSVTEPLRKLVEMHACAIKVLHIADDEKTNEKELLITIEDLNPSVTNIFGSSHINRSLNTHLTKEDADLLCLVRSKKDFFSRIFNESVTLKQTFSSPIPLLILHN
jgi:nucleotide-binding universal stress UspA family protein